MAKDKTEERQASIHSVLSKANEHQAVVNITTLHNRFIGNQQNKMPEHKNILVKEITLNKSGPSLFGRISESKEKTNLSNKDGQNKVLVIETGLKPNVASKLSEVHEKPCEKASLKESHKDLAQQQTRDLEKVHIKHSERDKTGSTHVNMGTNEDRVTDMRNQYKTKESRRKLWGLVQPPCANELLRAKRENLTLDDIYEEKISKLLEKIGLNTFQGIPISQFFTNDDNLQKTDLSLKDVMKKKDNEEVDHELISKLAQKARYQEQVKVKLQAVMEMIERRKNLKRYYTSQPVENLSKSFSDSRSSEKGCSENKASKMAKVDKSSIGGNAVLNLQNVKEKGLENVSNGVVQTKEQPRPNMADKKAFVQTVPINLIPISSKGFSQKLPIKSSLIPLVSKGSSQKVPVKSSPLVGNIGIAVKSIPSSAPVFDGVFKIPTKCLHVFNVVYLFA